MENATKALMIAGGVLLALLILALIVYIWVAVGNYTGSASEKKAQEQLNAFNRQYEVYQRQILRGSDVASVINKIRDNNRLFADDTNSQMTWEFTIRRSRGSITSRKISRK